MRCTRLVQLIRKLVTRVCSGHVEVEGWSSHSHSVGGSDGVIFVDDGVTGLVPGEDKSSCVGRDRVERKVLRRTRDICVSACVGVGGWGGCVCVFVCAYVCVCRGG